MTAHWSDRLQRFDRRWIFLIMGLAIVVPLYIPLGFPIKPSPMTKAAFAAVEELHAGDVVFVSMDVDPASTAELEPYYRAVILQLKRKDIRLAFVTLWYQAPPLVERWLRETVDGSIAGERPYERNIDYVNLGFREGKQNIMLGMGADLPRVFDGKTEDGTPLDSIPWMKPIRGLADFKLMVLVSAGSPGAKEYVEYVQNRYALRMVAVTTAVSTTDLAPYYQSGQLLGLVAGLSGSAEYEILVGRPSIGVEGADVLNAGHGVVIIAIVLGNIAFFAGRQENTAMTELAAIDIFGAWVGIFLTMCVLSFLYGDNPFYKLAEHLFIGVSIGYVVVVQFKNNIYVKASAVADLWDTGRGGWLWDRIPYALLWDLVPIALVAAMFVKLASKRLTWLGRFPLAFVVALYAGQSITGLVGSDLGDQIKTASRSIVVDKVDLNSASANALSQVPGVSPAIATKLVAERAQRPFDSIDDAASRPSLSPDERADLAAERGGLIGVDARAAVAPDQIDWFGIASQLLLLVALLTGLLYFYFSIAHRGAIGRVSRVGVWILMIGFGASFGWTVQGRIALAIARAQDIRGKFTSPHDAARIHGEVAAIVSTAIIIAGIWWWERRRPLRGIRSA